MKRNISSAEAAILLPILQKMHAISGRSMVIATLLGIDRHELNKIKALILRLGNNENETWKKQDGAVKNCEKAGKIKQQPSKPEKKSGLYL